MRSVAPEGTAILRMAGLGLAILILVMAFALACTFVYIAPSLPTTETLHNKEMPLPLRILAHDGELISRFGVQRRIPVRYEEIPPLVRQAFLAAEDDRFFEHRGVDWMGVSRAVFKVVTSGKAVQGGSTITQQTARQMYLTLDKNLRRKLAELFVTWRMEHDFTKEQILATYLNVIYFGQRSYGIAAASETYYGRKLAELDVAQAAALAGVVQYPPRNPVADPRGTEKRRRYVLGRMLKLGYIDKATAEAAAKESVASRGFAPLIEVEGDYVAELARQQIIARLGESAINEGYTVITTIDAHRQIAANSALRLGLMEYDRRYGYRGRAGSVALSSAPTVEELDYALGNFRPINILQPAIVTAIADTSAAVYTREQGAARINWEGLSWARRPAGNGVGPAVRKAADVLKRGDVVYVIADEHGNLQLSQLPQAQAALVALDPDTGAILSMVGGFDFNKNAFNRVTQAHRQPGSGFKPFLYSAALENGLTAASAILNQPIVSDDACSGEDWRPKNSGGEFGGPTRLREALVHSLNLVSIRILQRVGVDTAIDYAARFGFDPESLPHCLSLALGTQVATPQQMAAAYAVFANGGFKVDPYLIERIEDEKGQVVFEAAPKIACPTCEGPDAAGSKVPEERRAPRVISAQNAWLMSDIMHDVATQGTGNRTQELGRDDLAGKTGTTDKPVRDNWFNGFNSRLVASVWVGYDDERSLGEHEEGASTAVPIWNLFMREALHGMPSARMPRPDGIVELKISASTGELAEAGDADAITEFFMADHLPAAPANGGKAGGAGGEPVF